MPAPATVTLTVLVELQFETDISQYDQADPVLSEQAALSSLGLSEYIAEILDEKAAVKYVTISRVLP